MKRFVLFAAVLALAACSTVGKVTLDADKGFALAQLGFKTAQQAAITCIEQHVPICTANKAKIIDLVDQGQALETKGFTAQQAANSVAEGDAATALINIVGALNALGVKGI